MKNSINFSGTWKNTKGSILEVVQTGSDIKGTYQTAVGEPNFKDKCDIVGFANEDSIAFVINYYPNGMHASFTGVVKSTNEKPLFMNMSWHLVRKQTEDTPIEYWARTLTGADTFQKN